MMPLDPISRRYWLQERATEYDEEFPRPTWGAMINAVDKAVYDCRPDCEKDVLAQLRYLVFGWVFTPDDQPLQPLRTKDLTNGQKYAVYKWVKPEKVEGVWTSRPGFALEVRWIVNRAHLDQSKANVQMIQNIEYWREHSYLIDFEVERHGLVENAVRYMGGVISVAAPEQELDEAMPFQPSGAVETVPDEFTPVPVHSELKNTKEVDLPW